MIIDWINFGIGKAHIALDCSITIFALLQFTELLLSVITVRLSYVYAVLCHSLASQSIGLGWVTDFMKLVGWAGLCQFPFFFYLVRGGVNWWYGISCNILEIGIINLILHPVCCTQLKNQTLCAYKVDLRQDGDFSYHLLI